MDNTEKANIIAALKSKNYLQFEWDSEISYKHKKGWGFSFGNHAGLYAKYNQSLVQLSLLGNTPFKNDSLQLSPLEVTAFHYSKVEVSYQWHPRFSTSLALISGHQLANMNVKNAIFSTGESASSIGYELDFEGHYSDTTDLLNNVFKSNGIGAALGFSFSDVTDKGSFTVSVFDLGFIRWNESTNNMYINSEWSFEGVNMDDFIEFNDSIITNDIDSIQATLNKVTSESYTWQIPATIALSLHQHSSSKYIDAYGLSLVHKLGIYDAPRLSMDLFKSFGKHEVSIGCHIGGFERPGFQFGYGFSGQKMTYSLFTKQANSIVPSQNYGLHLGFGIKRVFSTSK